MTQTSSSFVPFDAMVNNLFKRGPYSNTFDNLVHAAMGILGECIELEAGEAEGNIKNVIEESGDVEFYLEAAFQLIVMVHRGVAFRCNQGKDAELLSLSAMPLVELAEQFHDKVKKIWVYGQDIQLHVLDLAYLIGQMRGRLEVRYDINDTPREQILSENQAKLALRYPGGVYTDKAAKERADKAESAVLQSDPATTEGADND